MSHIPEFPIELLPPQELNFDLAGLSIVPPTALSGASEAIDYSGGGHWWADYNQIHVMEPAAHLAWLQMRNRLNGHVQAVNVPLLTDWVAPRKIPGESLWTTVTHSDDTTHSDGTPYRQATIEAKVVGAVALNAGQVTVRVTRGGTLVGGETFSVYHATRGHRAYPIEAVLSTATVGAAKDYTVQIRLPWREASTGDLMARFVRPLCKMILKPGTSMAWTVKGKRELVQSVSFVEDMR